MQEKTIYNGGSVSIENSILNCSASQGLPSDAEQLSLVTEFSVCARQPLKVLIFFPSRLNNQF